MAKIKIVTIEKDPPPPPGPLKMLPPPSGDATIIIGPSPEEIAAAAAYEGMSDGDWCGEDMRRMLEAMRLAEPPKQEPTKLQAFLTKRGEGAQVFCLVCHVGRPCQKHAATTQAKEVPSGVTQDPSCPNREHGPTAQHDQYPGQYL